MGVEVKVLTTFFDCIRSQIGKLWQMKRGQGAKDLAEWQ